MKRPDWLTACNPEARSYPKDWKWEYYKSHGGTREGYLCPHCKQLFTGNKDFVKLHADHIVPWSQSGPTTWENLQVLCGPCNLRKSAASE